jgi:hypothetical protein
MTSLAVQLTCRNAAQTAHRIDLHIGGQYRRFLTASLDKNPGDNHGRALEAAESKRLEHADGDLRLFHRCAAAGNNTFRKGITAHAPSC